MYDTAQAQANAFARLGEDDPAPQLALDGVEAAVIPNPDASSDILADASVLEALPAFDLVPDAALEQKTESAPNGDEPHES